ncbi:mandelate racemase/muconate lactonizing enzyme family protein [Pseudomonas lalucatii]|nr:mandelate racemase/muconate lactonizing enzyme family protein [Pseudomonas lalucatii]
MKITRISIYRKSLSYGSGAFAWGRGNVIESSSSTVVVIDTDAGISGVGEFCPCGENYMVAHSEGTEAAARLLAPRLLGEDPRQLARIERLMDSVILGHGYAKAPFDSACWDILGKATGQPVWMLLGGKLTDGAPMYRSAPQGAAQQLEVELERLRGNGYRQFQIKVGNDWKADVERIHAVAPLLRSNEKAIADANQGWYMDEAIQVARATRGLDFIIEQPCHSYEECLQVRRHFDQPMKLDECITDLRMAERVVADRAFEYVCLKLSKQGGLSKAKRMRDYLVDHRIKVVSEDTWGGEIATAAVAHFAASTPADFLLNTTDLHSYNNERTGQPAPRVADGKLYASDTPGLGVEADLESLGPPVAVYGRPA